MIIGTLSPFSDLELIIMGTHHHSLAVLRFRTDEPGYSLALLRFRTDYKGFLIALLRFRTDDDGSSSPSSDLELMIMGTPRPPQI